MAMTTRQTKASSLLTVRLCKLLAEDPYVPSADELAQLERDEEASAARLYKAVRDLDGTWTILSRFPLLYELVVIGCADVSRSAGAVGRRDFFGPKKSSSTSKCTQLPEQSPTATSRLGRYQDGWRLVVTVPADLDALCVALVIGNAEGKRAAPLQPVSLLSVQSAHETRTLRALLPGPSDVPPTVLAAIWRAPGAVSPEEVRSLSELQEWAEALTDDATAFLRLLQPWVEVEES